jgi:hypothetical protein
MRAHSFLRDLFREESNRGKSCSDSNGSPLVDFHDQN